MPVNPLFLHFSNEELRARVGREAHSRLAITHRSHRELSQAVAGERESSQAGCSPQNRRHCRTAGDVSGSGKGPS